MSTPLGQHPPVAGGIDLDLPGVDVRLRATRWPGAGVPVLLLHGLASTRRFWDLVAPRLAGLPVVALDQRGHGDSDRPAGPYDGATVARDALTALDALGYPRAVVVGHSWGASTALRIAAESPERVLAVVAVDGGLGASALPPGAERTQARARLEPPRTALPVAELRERLAQGPLAPWWNPDVEAAVLAIFEEGPDGLARARLPFATHMAIVDDLLDTDPAGWLPQIACPAWLVAAEQVGGDPWGARKAAALEHAAGALARPRLQRWAGAVHDVPLQWPALVAGLIRAAVEEISPSASVHQ